MSLSKFPALTMEEVNGYREMDFTDAQIEKLNKKAKENHNKQLSRFTIKRLEQDHHPMKELRLVLLGKTGAGKSATGNLIIGERRFKESSESVSCTSGIQVEEAVVDGIRVRIIDTPGLFDTSADMKTTLTKIAQFIDTFSDGVHGFLLVFNLGNCRFTEEERKVFAEIDQTFARKDKNSHWPLFSDHCFIILTHGKDMVKHDDPEVSEHGATKTRTATQPLSLTEKLESETDTPFGKLLIHDMKKKVIAVENGVENGYFREELRKQVVRLVTNAVSEPYTNKVFEEFLKHQGDVASGMDPSVRTMAATIEQEVAKELQGLSHDGIKGLPESDKKHVIGNVLENLGSKWQQDISKEQLEKATSNVIEGKKERLTSAIFLEKVEEFGKGLLKVIKVGFQIAVTTVQVVNWMRKLVAKVP